MSQMRITEIDAIVVSLDRDICPSRKDYLIKFTAARENNTLIIVSQQIEIR